MRNADLAEIRARLQAAAAEDRPRPGLFAALHAWPRRSAPAAPVEPAAPPAASAPPLHAAFGQRAETIETPLQLEAPLPPEPPSEAPLLLAHPIVEPRSAASRRPRRPRRGPRVENSVLVRLERMLLAEQAALEARRG